jgi:RNA polymerase sigma-70 factor, ECF subfamily
VQTVFLDFYRAVAKYQPEKGMLKVWLLQYAYHRALHRKRHLAASRFYKWVDLDAGAEPALSWSPTAVSKVARLMEQLLGTISPRKRQVLEFTYFEGLTAEEIAVRLGESVNVVRHELYRALASLRRAVAKKQPVLLDRTERSGKEALGAHA